MVTKELTELHLRLTVQQGVTVLPRILQILSRRGFTLTDLTTKPHANGTATLLLTTVGDSHWHDAVPHLVSRLVDVLDAQKETRNV